MKKYEYKCVTESTRPVQWTESLNKESENGWEFIQITKDYQAIYRREIKEFNSDGTLQDIEYVTYQDKNELRIKVRDK